MEQSYLGSVSPDESAVSGKAGNVARSGIRPAFSDVPAIVNQDWKPG